MPLNKWTRTQTNAWYQEKPLLDLNYITSGLGDTRCSFRLTYSLPNSLWASAESSPIHVFFLPGLETSPLLLPYWFLLHMPWSSAASSASSTHVPPLCYLGFY